MKRVLSLMVAIVLCISLLPPVLASGTAENVVVLMGSNTVSHFSNMRNGLYHFYNESEDAVQFATTAANDPYIDFNIGELENISADTYKYVVVTYRAATSNDAGVGSTQFFWYLNGVR